MLLYPRRRSIERADNPNIKQVKCLPNRLDKALWAHAIFAKLLFWRLRSTLGSLGSCDNGTAWPRTRRQTLYGKRRTINHARRVFKKLIKKISFRLWGSLFTRSIVWFIKIPERTRFILDAYKTVRLTASRPFAEKTQFNVSATSFVELSKCSFGLIFWQGFFLLSPQSDLLIVFSVNVTNFGATVWSKKQH